MALQISATNPEHPALLLELPWQVPLEEWPDHHLVPLPRGISRHVVRYARAGDEVVAVKELAERPAVREYELLLGLDRLGIPAVDPLAVVTGRTDAAGEPLESVLITRHLGGSQPYRSMFETTMRPATMHRLMDALAVLLVRLHLAGFAWGDCSLSNTLFRRDAGAYAAYLVDAETGDLHPQLSTGQREYDLDLARVNISGELLDLEAAGALHPSVDPVEFGAEICARYRSLWQELTRTSVYPAGKYHYIDRRVRRLNDLGFDVAEMQIAHSSDGDTVTFVPKVVDAGHHQRQLLRLTGLDTEENQARRLLNDLESWMATQDDHAPAGRPGGAAGSARPEVLAHRWVRDVFRPTVRAVPPALRGPMDPAELYHEILEHRWFLSERAEHDIGLDTAVEDYVRTMVPRAREGRPPGRPRHRTPRNRTPDRFLSEGDRSYIRLGLCPPGVPRGSAGRRRNRTSRGGRPMTQAAGPARTVILTVDDDPGVSRAVARDLRRRYGEGHRIVRAESGDAALDALRELKLRGDQVAVILADYRMPQMDGIEFLEQAIDIFPGARRILLTAYADTNAAIDAINVIDLDHYLLKPWDPPEEKLYPVVDDLLDAWRVSDYKPVGSCKVVGHRWSARSSGVREFLARNQVPYRWYSSDTPEGERLLRAAEQDGQRLPLVITPDGTPLVEPDDHAIAAHVGLATTPAADFYDLVVIGGGPAGLGAAVYGASEGLRTVLVERSATGGQAGQSSRIENYLGFPDGVSGAQLTDRARRQAAKFGAEILTAREVSGLEVTGASRTIRFSDGSSISAHAVILATGVSYRQLEAPGLDELTGCGVFYGSALTEAAACQGHDVYIVGGANSAGQAAMYLARGAKSVTILVRGGSLAASMSHYLIEQIENAPTISVRTGTVVEAAHGSGHLEQLTLRDVESGHTELVDAQWLFVFIGAAPLTGWLDGTVLRDSRGFIMAGPDMTPDGQPPHGWELDRPPYHLETNVPGVFVAGDARAESAKRVASAVGEGAMAVMLVHRYLEQS